MTLATELTAQKTAIDDMAPAEVLSILNNSVAAVEVSGIVANAVGVGDQAPAFVLPDPSGATVALPELLTRGPVVVSFYRGGWCPFCNLELRALQAVLPELTAAGASLVAISPQIPDESLSTKEKADLDFHVLSDLGSEVIRRYGLVYQVDDAAKNVLAGFGNDLERLNGTDTWELPVPATYVIGTDGIVTYAFADADYRRRAEPRDIVAAVLAVAAIA